MRFGSFQWTKVAMGLCCDQATFQKAMQLVLLIVSWEEVIVYLDEIIVHGTNFQDIIRAYVRYSSASTLTFWNSNQGRANFVKLKLNFYASYTEEVEFRFIKINFRPLKNNDLSPQMRMKLFLFLVLWTIIGITYQILLKSKLTYMN